jgi:hypothetical protein
LRGLIGWLRRRRAGWSGDSDRAFHDELFAAHHHDAFSPAYTGNITIRRFADLAAPAVEGCSLVVDVGCGLGEITCELARRFPDTRFLGVDHSRAGIDGARANAERLDLDNIAFEVHDMEGYDPGTDVDLVTMFDAFHHLLDPRAFIVRLGKRTRRFLLIEPQGDWKGSWRRDLDFDWLAADLEKIRARLAHAVGESAATPGSRVTTRHPGSTESAAHGADPGAGAAAAPGDAGGSAATPEAGEPVENRYSIATLEKLFAGYGLRVRGTVSGLDEYPPEPSLDTPTRREFGEVAYQLYRTADERLGAAGLDLHAKHLVIYAEAGVAGEHRTRPDEAPGDGPVADLRGAHDVAWLHYDGPQSGTPSSSVHATVRLRNRSFRVLSSTGDHPDMLSYHWLDEHGRTIEEDGARSPLPRDVAPDEEIEVALRIDTPARTGALVLAVDMVQEGRTWFRNAGCPTLDVSFRVG